ncbi:nucleotidyltransferase domain-containing protein [Sulfuriferula thiophila]|uniref:nucleotidyltransferase domain-containing protein n=1 Tax=Sulfuriferula thiophila TaxID=1781211 RepID=UPI000F60580A|nr:nucleotidyltransferase domain-containing protein [Sulfuriferula thiophila]
MRLTQEQQTVIRTASLETFGEGVGVWLFGSRVDDDQRGGDIDILLDIPEPVDNPALLAARFSAKVSRLMHGRKVDVLLSAPNLMRLPIHDIAFKEGQKL